MSPLSNEVPSNEGIEIVHDGFFVVQKEKLRYPRNNKLKNFYTLVTAPVALMVLAQTPEGKYIINKEYRHPTGQFLLSCPGGAKDEEEESHEGAARELLEETGYRAEEIIYLGEAYPFPGIAIQKIIYFKGKGALKVADPTPEPSEIFETHLFTREELLRSIREGIPTDGLLCTALFFESLLETSF